MKQTILVVGASGTVGSELTKILQQSGHTVRQATSKSPSTGEQVHLNLVSGEGLSEAFAGVDKAFFLAPGGYTEQEKLIKSLVLQAQKSKVKKVVFMSAMGANANPESGLRKAEIAVEGSGLVYNIIRPNWFMQNFQSYWVHDIRSQGKILLPAGDAKVSFIDTRDIARVAAKLLTSSEFDNQAFDLSGPAAINHQEAATALSKASGKDIVYAEISPADLKTKLISVGLPPDFVEVFDSLFGFLRLGYSSQVTDAVKTITGSEPLNIDEFAHDYKAAWM